jgi:hypothetical protein
MERLAETAGVDLVTFEKGPRKDDLAQTERDESWRFHLASTKKSSAK